MLDIALEPETERMLAEAAAPGKTHDPRRLRLAALYSPCDELVNDFLCGLGLPMIPYYFYRRFCRSLTAAFRKYSGERLSVELQVSIARWQANGLDPVLMQRIVVLAWDRLKLASEALDAAQTLGQP